jgi:hypothetical protein
MARIFTLLLVFFTNTSAGLADFYQAPMQQARWEFKQINDSCYLRQRIPLYGSADFIYKVGGPLFFSLQEERHKPLIMKASLKVMPAPWMHEPISALDYPVYLDNPEIGGYSRLYVYGDAAEAMIDMLLQGHYPTFIYLRDASLLNLEETRVAISAIRFAESYKEFLTCRNNMTPITAQGHSTTGRKTKQRG